MTIAVELEQADLSTVEQEQVDQVLTLPNTERAADILLASESLIESAGKVSFPLSLVLSTSNAVNIVTITRYLPSNEA